MYEKIIIGLLLLGLCSSEQPIGVTANAKANTTPGTSSVSIKKPDSEGGKGTRQQYAHSFSAPVIIGIIFVVMTIIIGIILLLAYVIGLLTKKSSLDIQPTFSDDTGDPLTSIETGNTESNQ